MKKNKPKVYNDLKKKTKRYTCSKCNKNVDILYNKDCIKCTNYFRQES